MKFAIEQIAIVPPDAEKAIAFLRALGAHDWVKDLVVATGSVYGEPGKTNVAELNFNYQLAGDAAKPLEFEVLSYKAGENWMQHMPHSVSHLGTHCTAAELSEVDRIMRRHSVPIVQEVDTQSHTNPAIMNSRRYKYVIYGTRPILGVDLKFIVRKELTPATTNEA